MAILGYKDILQYPATGAEAIWSAKAASIVGGSAGTAVPNAPVSNLLDPSLSKVFQMSGVGTGTVSFRIDVTAAGTGAEALFNYGVIGILGLRAIPTSPVQGYDYDLNVRVRNFSGFDRTLTYYGAETAGQWPKQLWFSLFTGRTEDPAAARNGGPGNAGFTLGGGFQIDVTENMALSTTYTLEVGRIVVMNCITGRFEPTPTIDFEESGGLVRSFGGSPYNQPGARLRRLAGRFIALPDQAVYGHSANEAQAAGAAWISTLNRVNKEAGKRGEAVLIPEDYSTALNTVSGRNYYPSAWQTRPVFGQLDDGLNVSRSTTTQASPAPGTQVNALWDAQVSITENPTA